MRVEWKGILPECTNNYVGFNQNNTNDVNEIEAIGNDNIQEVLMIWLGVSHGLQSMLYQITVEEEI